MVLVCLVVFLSYCVLHGLGHSPISYMCGNCSDPTTCDPQDGRCTGGCKIGYMGLSCDELCSNCAGNGSCSQIKGVCHNGCRTGFRGDICILGNVQAEVLL
uniref:EGF-like domain-containing protein n=1 Tax=Biomphalaria glabrata TaxID=6526 RepID=A0A2C9LBF8_BIOGL